MSSISTSEGSGSVLEIDSDLTRLRFFFLCGHTVRALQLRCSPRRQSRPASIRTTFQLLRLSPLNTLVLYNSRTFSCNSWLISCSTKDVFRNLPLIPSHAGLSLAKKVLNGLLATKLTLNIRPVACKSAAGGTPAPSVGIEVEPDGPKYFIIVWLLGPASLGFRFLSGKKHAVWST